MKDKKIFIDTNILIYAYSSDEISKKHIVDTIIYNGNAIISTQVINEFINVMRKKRKITFDKLTNVVQEFSSLFSIASINIQTIEQALKIAQKYNFSYFDSLMLSSALECSCSIIYTEDMHHEQIIENKLIIKNPFKSI
ncbi:MAG TPA: PIN domain-containing protein [Candidatus Babeliales bacterium]|jgi:predicted nucleic acid-binding protein|nr:PIN domain-containing protein [Candidatus Babeliales bacterium]